METFPDNQVGWALFEGVPDVIYMLKTKTCDPTLRSQLSEPF